MVPQGRLDFCGPSKLLPQALLHLLSERACPRVNIFLVNGEQLSPAQNPAPIDHDIGHGDSILTVNELIDNVVERNEVIGVSRQHHDVRQSTSLDDAGIPVKPESVRAAGGCRAQDVLWSRPFGIIAI